MKRIIPILAVVLLGAQLSACSADRQTENQPVSTEAPAKAAAPTQEPTATPASMPNDETANRTAQPSGAAASGSSDDALAAPLYRMTKAYRFVPIEESTTDKVVLLTFDDGPKDESILTSMLDTLDKHGAKAIFFVNGYRVKQNPELLKLINERGQTIGNHSWDHINLKNETKEVVEKQIGDVQTDVEDLIGKKPIFFRPPFGSGGDVVREIVKNHGMLYMTWSDGSLDWDKSTKDKPEEVIRNVLEQLHPGANILMHELPWTAAALEKLLTALEEKGYGYIDPASIDINR
jgi:peptidoglycan/xylan/chitin deacetylase (PgdA/CDA1 family)